MPVHHQKKDKVCRSYYAVPLSILPIDLPNENKETWGEEEQDSNLSVRVAHDEWEGADLRLQAAVEAFAQRANEGQVVPQSVGIPRAGARLPQSLAPNQLGLVYRRGRLEALG